MAHTQRTPAFMGLMLVFVVVRICPGESGHPETGSELRMYGVLNAMDAHPEVLDWLPRQDWLWGVEVLPSATAESVRNLRSRGLRILLEMRAHPDARAREAERKCTAVPDPAAELKRFIDAAGTDVIWEPLLEDDSAGVAFPQRLLRARPRTHGEAKQLFDAYLSEALPPTSALPKVERWGVCGYASSAHAFAAHGLDCILVERTNDDVEDLQTAVAFARGAARQYGKRWGIDLSLWWGPIYGCVQYLPASLYKRHLYLSYFSGARAFRIEGADLLARDTGGKDTPVGVEMAAFHRIVKSLRPGEPEVPVAAILPEDHGWMTPPYWRTTNTAWSFARLPYRPGERGIDGFFGAAFPGSVFAMDAFPFGAYASEDPPASPFSLACVTPEFSPRPDDRYQAPAPLPFGRFQSRDEARGQFFKDRTDPSPYRAMSDSRWGDIFDVLTDPADDSVLQQYGVIVLLGPIKLTEDLAQRLRRFVENGGRLIAAAGVVGPSDQALTGLAIQPEQRVGRAWRWAEERLSHEAYRYLPCSNTGTPGGTTVLARSQSDEPLVVCHQLGKGFVYTCLVPWYEAGHICLSGAAQRLFDVVFDEFQFVKVEGPPCEWLSSKGEQGRYIVIANHDGTCWHGKVRVRSTDAAVQSCTELLTGEQLEVSRTPAGDTEMMLSVPPYDVRVLQLHPQAVKQRGSE